MTPRKIEPSAISGLLLWYRTGIRHLKVPGVVCPAWPRSSRDELAKSDALRQDQGWLIMGKSMGNGTPRQKNGCSLKLGTARALEEGGNV